MSILICLFCFVTVANATLLSRLKRFLTPTTSSAIRTPFLAPSTMSKRTGSPTFSSFSISTRASFPLKRGTISKRVKLDSNLMREIYLQDVGAWDPRLVAETLQEARDNFIDLTEISDTLRSFPRRQQNRAEQINTSKDNNAPVDGATSHENTWKPLALENNTILGILGTRSPLGNLLGLERLSRVKRNLDGSETTTNFCHPRGTRTDDGYIHMCSTCAFTTKLPMDRFPRYVNEVGCDSGDCKCFTVNDVSHGECRPRVFMTKILRKVSTGHRMVIREGEHLITDNWELYDQPLKVGCECVIDKRSPFASFMGRS